MFFTMVVIVGIIGFLSAFVMLAAYFANQTKNNMICIAFGDPRSLREVQAELGKRQISYARTPNEIWVRRADAEKTKNLIEAKYYIEITLTAILVFNRRNSVAS